MTVSADYIAKEEAVERKPVELYHLWTDHEDWYYTNTDVAIYYGGVTYLPAVLQRGSLEKDSQLNATKLSIAFAYIEAPVVEYIADNSVELTWISVMRVFQDQTPIEAAVIFVGQIRDITFKGQQGQVTCVGFEYFLNKPLPKYRYQPQCNWKLYSTRCQINKETFADVYGTIKQSLTVTWVQSDGLSIACAGMVDHGYNFYKGGDAETQYTQSEKRMIAWSSGIALGFRFKFRNLIVGDGITIYPGCDGAVNTCITKFNNIENFGGFPYIPMDNPVAWVWS
jgi:uncharacterized phage protein (TIGR02218 family)